MNITSNVLVIRQGDSRVLVLPVIDELGQPIDLSAALDVVLVLHDHKDVAYAKFASDTGLHPGYGELTFGGGNYWVQAELVRAQTRGFKRGPLYATVVASFPPGFGFSENQTRSFTYQVAQVVTGVALNEMA